MAALVVLAGRLPGDPEPGGDLRPAKPELDGTVDQRCEFGFCPLLRDAGTPDPVQYLRRGHPGNLLCHARGFRWRVVLPIRPAGANQAIGGMATHPCGR